MESAVDWITATTQDSSVGESWFRILKTTAKEWSKESPLTDWRFFGFEGFRTGQPRVSWGVRHSDKRFIIMAAGRLADDIWPAVVPCASNISRLDVQCTVTHSQKNLAEYWYRQVVAYPVDRRLTYRLVEASQGGQTLYVGSRQSDLFGRLYDKGAERGGKPGRLWRYEVEIKGGHAGPTAKKLYSDLQNGIPVRQEIAAYVWSFFDGRGVRPVYLPNADVWKVKPAVLVTSARKKLRWLSEQVSPTVTWLFENGRGEDALEALGITPEFIERMAQRESETQSKFANENV